MVIPIIRNAVLPSIETIHELTLKYIFNKPQMKYEEEAVLMEGIEGWSKKVDKTPDQVKELKRIVHAIIADEKGYFYRAKILLKQHNLHYRQLYKAGLPYINMHEDM